MCFDKLIDTLTMFFSSDFSSTFYVAFFLHYFPARFIVLFLPLCSFGAFVAWQSIFPRFSNTLIQKWVLHEVLCPLKFYLCLQIQKTLSPTWTIKCLKLAMMRSLSPTCWQKIKYITQMLMHTCACDKGSFLLFVVLLEELSSIWYYIVSNQSRNKGTDMGLELACNWG